MRATAWPKPLPEPPDPKSIQHDTRRHLADAVPAQCGPGSTRGLAPTRRLARVPVKPASPSHQGQHEQNLNLDLCIADALCMRGVTTRGSGVAQLLSADGTGWLAGIAMRARWQARVSHEAFSWSCQEHVASLGGAWLARRPAGLTASAPSACRRGAAKPSAAPAARRIRAPRCGGTAPPSRAACTTAGRTARRGPRASAGSTGAATSPCPPRIGSLELAGPRGVAGGPAPGSAWVFGWEGMESGRTARGGRASEAAAGAWLGRRR